MKIAEPIGVTFSQTAKTQVNDASSPIVYDLPPNRCTYLFNLNTNLKSDLYSRLWGHKALGSQGFLKDCL